MVARRRAVSSAALAWAMQTDAVDDPLDRLILIYLGDNAGGGDDDYVSRYDEGDELLRRWTGLDSNELLDRLRALDRRDIVHIEDPDSLTTLAPSCDVVLGGGGPRGSGA